MYKYFAYNNIIHSDFDIPELPRTESASNPDLIIREIFSLPKINEEKEQLISLIGADKGDAYSALSHSKESVRLNFFGMAQYFIDRRSQDISIFIVSDFGPRVRNMLLTMIFAIVFSMRKNICLHASVMKFANNKCAAFLGSSGAGKSTLAYSFWVSGIPLMTDDLAVLSSLNQRITVSPAYPRVRLRFDNSLLNQNTPNFGIQSENDQSSIKRCIYSKTASDRGFVNSPKTLEKIYLLNRGAKDFSIEAINNKADCLVLLLRNSFSFQYLELFDKNEYLSAMALTAERVPVFKLNYPDSFAEFRNVKSELLKHICET